MPQGVVIIGLQWGDEGKGKIVDYYARSADSVARFQGGNNAGHTIVVEDKTTVLHLIPSGVLHPHPQCLLGSGVVVDPEILLEEIDILNQAGVKLEDRLVISDRAHVILDGHKALDAAREGKRTGKKIGTTKRGIGPTYEDRSARRGLRMADLMGNPTHFRASLEDNLEEKNFLLKNYYGMEPLDPKAQGEKYLALAEKLRPFVGDVATVLHHQIEAGKKILFEGAQGILLDNDYGTYPYVTSSHTLPSQAALGLGARLPKETLFLGVVKAYTTRVGEGPFPTELHDDFGTQLRKAGGEFGATTGRPRRCGWLDLVAANYAIQVSGLKNLAVTKADVLCGLDEIKVCTAYKIRGETVTSLPADVKLLEEAEPVYETLPGWKESLDGIRKPEDIPSALKNYLKFIEDRTGSKINLVSTGAGREAVIDILGTF